MPKVERVLDKGEALNGAEILERYSVDAAEIVKSDPKRFSILPDDDQRLPTQDLMGEKIRRKAGTSKKA
jgi:hypothetical protein